MSSAAPSSSRSAKVVGYTPGRGCQPVHFAARTPLPPGYGVEWWEYDEMYHWVSLAAPDDVYGYATCRKWQAWRGAWAHYRASEPSAGRLVTPNPTAEDKP